MQATRRHATLPALATLAALGLAAALPQAAHAQFLSGSPTGLTNPTNTLTFSEVNPGNNTPLTNQFAAQGITFSGTLAYDGNNATGGDDAGLSGAYAETLVNGQLPPAPATFTITFNTAVTSAAFAAVDQGNSYTFTALLNGATVDSGTAIVPFGSGLSFYGFRNETFNAIRVTAATRSNLAIDTIQSIPAAVTAPEPSSVAAFAFTALGAAALILRARTRQTA